MWEFHKFVVYELGFCVLLTKYKLMHLCWLHVSSELPLQACALDTSKSECCITLSNNLSTSKMHYYLFIVHDYDFCSSYPVSTIIMQAFAFWSERSLARYRSLAI